MERWNALGLMSIDINPYMVVWLFYTAAGGYCSSLGRLLLYLDILLVSRYNILVNKEIAFLLLCVKREGNSPPFLLQLRRSLGRLPYHVDKRKIIWYNKVPKKKGTKL